MKQTIILVLSVYLLAFSSCKKSHPAPSIIGTWKFTNITGTVIYNNNPGSYDSLHYSYSGADSIYTILERDTDPFITDTSNYRINTENWSFNVDGTYSIAESYNLDGSPVATANSVTGVWEYLSNTRTDDGLILTGAASSILPNVSRDNNTYTIQTLNSICIKTF